jgi:hypothetical protein
MFEETDTGQKESARTRENDLWSNLFMKRETNFQMEFDDIAFVNGNSAAEVLCRGEQATQKGEERYEAHGRGGGREHYRFNANAK